MNRSQHSRRRLDGRSAGLAQALGHRHRLRILELLAGGERNVAAVARHAGLSVANASHHLRSMRDAGLLMVRREGKYVLYRVRDASALGLAAALQNMAERPKAVFPTTLPKGPRSSPDPFDWLAATAMRQPRLLVAGETLFRQGDAARAIYQVADGRVRLIRQTSDNRLVTLHTARAGELFAEASLFSATYHCDAVAAAPSRVWVYPKQPLLSAFQSDPAHATRFMATLAQQIQSLRARLEGRNIRSARERILHHLALAGGESRRVSLDGTLMDLAQEIGLSHEALYRALRGLEREGAIRRQGREIVLGADPAL
jgi:CRP/FNR family transcriptional regulator, dissimilatory nitrate respiration regulator